MSYPWCDASTWHADGGDDDLADDATAWCPDCQAHSSFSILPPEEIEGDLDPGWTYWCCSVCQSVPDVCPWGPACGCADIIDCAR